MVLIFDDDGVGTDRAILGKCGDVAVVENSASRWHASLPLDSGAVIYEAKHGP